LLKRLSFLHHRLLAPFQTLGRCSCMDSCPGPLFCSTGLHICFCANTVLFLLLWLCLIVWSQVLWYLQRCSFSSVFPWLVSLLCF
jgi:hypothetical protein